MKNIILGILGCMIAVYTIVSCLSIYSISTRKNEMENCISQVLKYHLNRYYATGVSDTEVEAFVRQEIRQQLHTASRVSIDVKSCDMVSGVISVRVTEDFVLPGGFHKSIACDKTILVETEVIEEETETEEIYCKRRRYEQKRETDNQRKTCVDPCTDNCSMCDRNAVFPVIICAV